MVNKLERKPSVFGILLIIGIWIVSGFASNSDQFLVWGALFVGVAGFVNSLWLNQRVNRIQEILISKNGINRVDFIVDEKEREKMKDLFKKSI